MQQSTAKSCFVLFNSSFSNLFQLEAHTETEFFSTNATANKQLIVSMIPGRELFVTLTSLETYVAPNVIHRSDFISVIEIEKILCSQLERS